MQPLNKLRLYFQLTPTIESKILVTSVLHYLVFNVIFTVWVRGKQNTAVREKNIIKSVFHNL